MLTTTTETREVITLASSGTFLRGTHHRPLPGVRGTAGAMRERIGVVFLNALSVPRSANGDSAVYWSEALARQGYPSFRLDLAGLGDSAGDIPMNLLEYIDSGGFSSSTAAGLRELAARYRLQGIVLVGHCSGAVSALYTAAISRECCGLILLDPYFHLPRTIRTEFRNRLGRWAAASACGRKVRDLYVGARRLTHMLRRADLPENANLPLLRRWGRLSSAGMPILVLRSPSRGDLGSAARVGFDYLSYGIRLAGPGHRISVVVIKDANHLFADRHTRQVLVDRTRAWLDASFATVDTSQPSMNTHDGLDEVAVSA